MRIRHSELQDSTIPGNAKALGQHFTPAWVAEALVERHFSRLGADDLVIEPSCGTGAFLCALPDDVPAIGVEIDPWIAQVARDITGREVILGDFQTVQINARPTAIIGNPPFNLQVIDGFLTRAFTMLPENGQVGLILPA
jgi:16S rRNA A1518/A1519 N6-dimethyltransferase RsmA/KsgA/DIM1 with predicted DNA glycosylase/AP lyase activity